MFFGDQNKYLTLYYAVSDVDCIAGMDNALYQGNGDTPRAYHPRDRDARKRRHAEFNKLTAPRRNGEKRGGNENTGID